MWWCHATPGDNSDNTRGRGHQGGREGAANGAENIENIHSARWAPALRCCQESLSAFASAVTCLRGGGGGMSDAYQVLMADTQRGRPPPAPPPVSVFVMRWPRLEAAPVCPLAHWPTPFYLIMWGQFWKLRTCQVFMPKRMSTLSRLPLPLPHLTL